MAIAPRRIPTNPGQSYDGVVFQQTRNDERFIIIAYQAKNAFGLIATEHNGIAILDNEKLQVLADGIESIAFGFSGLAPHQFAKARELADMGDSDFRQFVNGHPNTRYRI